MRYLSYMEMRDAILREARWSDIANIESSSAWNDDKAESVAEHMSNELAVVWDWTYWPFLYDVRYVTTTENTVTDDSSNDTYYSFDRIIDTEADIGAIPPGGVTPSNPLQATPTTCYSWLEAGTQVILNKTISDPTGVWVLNRPVAPRFTHVAFTGSYTAGQVSRVGDDCYRALTTTSTSPPDADWELQQIPVAFARYLRFAAAAELSRDHEEGDRPAELQARAAEELSRLHDVFVLQRSASTRSIWKDALTA